MGYLRKGQEWKRTWELLHYSESRVEGSWNTRMGFGPAYT